MSALHRFKRNKVAALDAENRTIKEALDFQDSLFLFQESLPIYYKIKVINETVWAFVLVLILIIPMSLVAMLIFLYMGSPIIFKQKRIGLNGRPFYIYKFRTMANGAPKVTQMGLKPLEKIENDPRVSGKLGKLLRKYKWDELPQLFNVLLGDMLLIGPRPYTYEENYEIKQSQSLRYAIKPGISGPWQVSGNLYMTPLEKIEKDRLYLNHLSFYEDIKILVLTLKVVMVGERNSNIRKEENIDLKNDDENAA